MHPDLNYLKVFYRNIDDPINVFVKANYPHLSPSGHELVVAMIKKVSVNSTKTTLSTIIAYTLCYTSALSLYFSNSF